MGSVYLPVLMIMCVFGCLALCLGVCCFSLVCLLISLPFFQLLLFEQGTPILFNFLLKFRNVLKHTENRSSFAINQNMKENIPTALEVFLCFETKRNINRSSTKTSAQRASNIGGRTGYNV